MVNRIQKFERMQTELVWLHVLVNQYGLKLMDDMLKITRKIIGRKSERLHAP